MKVIVSHADGLPGRFSLEELPAPKPDERPLDEQMA